MIVRLLKKHFCMWLWKLEGPGPSKNWTDFWQAFFICDSEYSFETTVAAGPSIGSRKSYPAPPLPPGLSKLFRIAQLIIQYLLHSQKKLTEAISSLQASNDHIKQVRKKYYRLSIRKVVRWEEEILNQMRRKGVQFCIWCFRVTIVFWEWMTPSEGFHTPPQTSLQELWKEPSFTKP